MSAAVKHWGLMIVIGLLAACSGNQPEAIFELDATVATCGEAIQAAVARPPCDADNCTLTVTFSNEDAALNQVRGATPRSTSRINPPDARTDELFTWHLTRLYIESDLHETTLVAVGQTRVSNITPQLDRIDLTTSDSTACADGPPPMLLVQSPINSQTNLTVNNIALTTGGTAAIRSRENTLTVYSLNGLSVISANGGSRILRNGDSLTISSDDPVLGDAEPFPDDFYQSLPLAMLPETFRIPDRIVPTINTTEAAIPNPTVNSDESGCIPAADFTQVHTVQRGENLTAIANFYDIDVNTLRDGNCLENPNRIRVGDEIRVPPTEQATIESTAPTRPTTAVVIPNTVGSTPLIVDGPGRINSGECSQLSWAVDNATSISLNGEPVANTGERTVCPTETTIYTLSVTSSTNPEPIRYSQVVIVAAG